MSSTQIFKSDLAFIKLFQLFKQKYRSLARMSGTVSIIDFPSSEIESIASFLGVSSHALARKGIVSLNSFEQQLAQSSFSSYSLLELVEDVLGERLQTKKDEQEMLQLTKQAFLNRIYDAMPEGGWWVTHIKLGMPDSRFIWAYFKEDAEQAFHTILLVYNAFCQRGRNGYERLPFFAQRTTGNPHAFDLNTHQGKLLLHIMYTYSNSVLNRELSFPKTTEERNTLLEEFGILRDDLWNFVTCSGLLAIHHEKLHPVWEASNNEQAALNMPMKELLKVQKVFPAQGNKVWIVENSSVASELMDACPNAAIICTHGQLRMAAWYLLDLLIEQGCRLFYEGTEKVLQL
ncbi:TIGR02679 domain-containing protein [Solibacillus sp. FSL H8-0538]|uniref:TIGR02679 domain-containing protein n=1 Tax=Solibacillus sp. FSL H8-0538 TaxID=2921400 RepID=UPI0030F6FF55